MNGALRRAAGVVTPWAPGGIGKTTLALAVAHELEDAAFASIREDEAIATSSAGGGASCSSSPTSRRWSRAWRASSSACARSRRMYGSSSPRASRSGSRASASATRSDFTASADALAAFAARTEGIPLAIELCAARLDALSIEELLARMESSFDVLATRRRDVDARHRTLSASIDVSHRMLDDDDGAARAIATPAAGDVASASYHAVRGNLATQH